MIKPLIHDKNKNFLKNFYQKYKYQLIIFFILFIGTGWYKLFLPGLTHNTGADEFNTINGALFLLENNWSEIVSRYPYHGFGYTMLMTPLFMLGLSIQTIKILMLIYNIICLSFCGVIAYSIMSNIFEIKDIKLNIITSIAAVCFFPNNLASTNNIFNDNMLVLLNWLILYLLLLMSKRNDNEKVNSLHSILLAFLLCYGNIVNLRMYFIWGAVFIYCIIYYIITKKIFLNLWIFIPLLIILFIIGNISINYYVSSIWTDDRIITNTAASLGRPFQRILSVFSFKGILAFIRLLTGQINTIFSFTGGLIFILISYLILCIVFLIYKKTRTTTLELIKENKYLFMAIIYTLIQIFAIILLVCLSQSPNTSIFSNSNDRRWFLYSKYWAVYAAPSIILFIVLLYKFNKSIFFNKIINISIILIIISNIIFSYMVAPILYDTVNSSNLQYLTFSPMSLMNHGDSFRPYHFFCVTLIAGIFTSVIYILIKKEKYIFIPVLILTLFIYNYSYYTFKIQVPISKERNNQYKHIVKLFKDSGIDHKQYPSISAIITNIHSLRNLQYNFYNHRVIPVTFNQAHLNIGKNYYDVPIVVSNNMSRSFLLLSGSYRLVEFPENNDINIFVNSNEIDLLNKIENAGYKINPFDSRLYNSRNLRYISSNPNAPVGWLAPGDIQYGPYITLPSGNYQISITGKGLSGANFIATYSNGNGQININDINITDNLVTYFIDLNRRYDRVEFLTINTGEDFIEIENVSFRIIERYQLNEIYIGAEDLYYILQDDREISPENQILYPGEIQYGPYINLPRANYKISISGSNLRDAEFKVTANSGQDEINKSNLILTDELVTYNISLRSNINNVEFVTYNNSDNPIYINYIVLE